MTVLADITYVFYLPQDYDEMKLFEAENDLSLYERKMDTIAVRYRYKTTATYPYKSKAEAQKDLLVTEYPQDGEVNLIGRDKTEAVVMAYDVYKELTEPWADYKKWDAPPKVDIPTGEITTCVSVLASALEDEPQKGK